MINPAMMITPVAITTTTSAVPASSITSIAASTPRALANAPMTSTSSKDTVVDGSAPTALKDTYVSSSQPQPSTQIHSTLITTIVSAVPSVSDFEALTVPVLSAIVESSESEALNVQHSIPSLITSILSIDDQTSSLQSSNGDEISILPTSFVGARIASFIIGIFNSQSVQTQTQKQPAQAGGSGDINAGSQPSAGSVQETANVNSFNTALLTLPHTTLPVLRTLIPVSGLGNTPSSIPALAIGSQSNRVTAGGILVENGQTISVISLSTTQGGIKQLGLIVGGSTVSTAIFGPIASGGTLLGSGASVFKIVESGGAVQTKTGAGDAAGGKGGDSSGGESSDEGSGDMASSVSSARVSSSQTGAAAVATTVVSQGGELAVESLDLLLTLGVIVAVAL